MKKLIVAAAIVLSTMAASGSARQPARLAKVVQPAATGMVSAADPRAAAAGVEILNAGGSATDAAIATMLALNVVEPQSSGMGGGTFFVRHDAASGKINTIDGREAAPMAADGKWFYDANGKPLSHFAAVPGGRSVGVPGQLRVMALAHAQSGKLPWARLFQPAIRLARDGFQASPRLANGRSKLSASGCASEGRTTCVTRASLAGTSAKTTCSATVPGFHRTPMKISLANATPVPIAFQPRTTIPASDLSTMRSIGVSATVSGDERSPWTSRNMGDADRSPRMRWSHLSRMFCASGRPSCPRDSCSQGSGSW